MVDIIRLENDGETYAKGFINQEGLTFYILKEQERRFWDNPIANELSFQFEVVETLPGGSR